ncbi:GDSL-type esterase/lipase family protein [Niallia oryzisoli]|uniref:GDSL-type esterase/lipase family protein n=1 Tax=Niallia oryzisoli TaxID=1737571 RepID=UPI003735D2A0
MSTKGRNIAALMLIISICFSLFFLIYHETAISKSTPVYEKIGKKHRIDYLIIGDSIGRGAGVEDRSLTWYSQWEKEMKKNYQMELKRHSVVQSGATAFEGLYLFKKAKIPSTVDLVFLIFGENDRKYMDVKQFSYYYEGLIREIKTKYPDAELITITESCLKQEPFAAEIKKISEHYHANHIDMRIPFQKSVYTEAQLTADFIHPNGLGYKLYADSIFAAITSGIETGKQVSIKNAPLTHVNELTINEISQYKEKNDLFHPFNSYYVSDEKGARITFPFNGTNLGVKVLKHEQGGEMDVLIDNQFVTRISTWWPIRKDRVLYITSGIPPGDHVVTFITTGTKSVNNKTTEHNVQLSSVLVFK